MVLVTCGQCDHRGIFVVTFPSGAAHPGEPWEADEPAIDGLRADDLEVPDAPISAEDVASMREFLSRFDGNFRRIFA
jgi:hypothetical protein